MTLIRENRDFTAVLLAGGRSTRMGRDKAFLEVGGQPLWRRQLGVLEALAPVELFLSAPFNRSFAPGGITITIVEDAQPGLGPLGGICAALQRMNSARLLVLAVDLPAMTSAFLDSLLKLPGGAIPHREGRFEPLAAVYPRAALPCAAELLSGPDLSLQRFARMLVESSLVLSRKIETAEEELFLNLNTPGDLDGLTERNARAIPAD